MEIVSQTDRRRLQLWNCKSRVPERRRPPFIAHATSRGYLSILARGLSLERNRNDRDDATGRVPLELLYGESSILMF